MGYADTHFLEKKLGAVFAGFENSLDEVSGIHSLLLQVGRESLPGEDSLLGVDGEVIVRHKLSVLVVCLFVPTIYRMGWQTCGYGQISGQIEIAGSSM